MKKGLVLEGGAMRGLFSAGVMDVMMERGVTFDAFTNNLIIRIVCRRNVL